MSSPQRPARFTPEDLTAPARGQMTVITTLVDFAIITFAISPEALAKHLPPGFEPEVFTLHDGTRCSLISAVPFRDLDFRFHICPWPTFAFGQTNYRAYVWYKGKRAAWFFGTSLATPLVLIPRHCWQLPWHHANMKFRTAWQDDVCKNYELTTTGAWGAAEVQLEGSNDAAGFADGFTDEEDMAVILTHPLVGYFYRRDGHIGSYSIWHDRLHMKKGIAKTSRFEVFEKLGFCDDGTKPVSVLLQKETEFTINLPPYLVSQN